MADVIEGRVPYESLLQQQTLALLCVRLQQGWDSLHPVQNIKTPPSLH